MNLQITAELLYTLKINLTALYLLFEGKWWVRLMQKSKVEWLLGLVEQSHNELKRLSNQCGVNFTYKPFYSAEQNHWLFDDPMHGCMSCRSSIRMRPTLKNRLLKRWKIGKHKNANLLQVA